MLPTPRATLCQMVLEALAIALPAFLLIGGLVTFTIYRDAQGLQQTTGRPPAPALRP